MRCDLHLALIRTLLRVQFSTDKISVVEFSTVVQEVVKVKTS